MNGKRFWSVKEAADYLSINTATLYQWLKNDPEKSARQKLAKLIGPPPPHRRFGTQCIRIPIKEFMEWAEPRKEKPNA